MSSTNRGAQRREADYYPTPAWCVHRLLDAVSLPGGVWLEPCAGEGHIIRAVNTHRAHPPRWIAVELREECSPALDALDCLTITADINRPRTRAILNIRQLDAIITNPPFKGSEEIVRNLLTIAELHGAALIVLQRLSFICSVRRGWHSGQMPDIYVLPNRPSFTGGETDSCDYAWFVWPPGKYHRTAGRIQRLALTDASERRGAP